MMVSVRCASFLGENTDAYIFVAVLILLAVGYTVLSIRTRKISRMEKEQTLAELEADAEFELDEVHVRVVSRCCGTRAYGTKIPRHEKGFFVTFMTDSGWTLEYRVGEETYLAVEEGMTGTLATCDGHFYGFCADEDAE